MRSLLPFLAPFALGAALALYLAVAFDDKKAGGIALMLGIWGAIAVLLMREETTDRALGPQLATLVGGKPLEPRWAREILGPWSTSPRVLHARWIVAREESWGSLFLLRLEVGKNTRETNLVLSVQGPELPTLTARRRGPPQRELVGELEQWDVTPEPGADERLVSRIVEAAQALEVSAFQVDGRKLWCPVRDPGAGYLGDHAAERVQALATLVARAAELGRDLRRLQV
ncbi:MAG TPA: hypothetical protein VGV61_02725 [Thermoanaerobaculia bacterium]|jgi:hypothetical protein|nr:hypothetical protein [Thermoanaerobaculia bacterium]